MTEQSVYAPPAANGQAPGMKPRGTSQLVYGWAKAGKALALDTPLPTPSGWTTMGAARPGTVLFNDKGEHTRVVAVSPVWDGRPCREVMVRGDRIIADAGHVWRMSGGKGNNRSRWHLGETDDLMTGSRRALPWTPGIYMPAVDLPVPPYVLGAWLGDGGTRQSYIHGSDLKLLVLERCIAEWGSGEIRRRNGHPICFLPGLITVLRAFGAIDGGRKSVPGICLRAGNGQRRELLAGLIDTDGYVTVKNTFFTNTNLAIAEAVCELAHTLGIRASISGPHKSFASASGKRIRGLDHYDVSLRGVERRHGITHRPDSLEKIPERRVKHFDRLYVESVTEVKSVPVRCIQVDDPHGMFLAGRSMIPTHNSSLGDSGPRPRLIADVEGQAYWTPSRKIEWNPEHPPPQPPDLRLTAGYGQPSRTPEWETAVAIVREARQVHRIYDVLNRQPHPFNSASVDSVTEMQQRIIDGIAGLSQMQKQDWGALLRQANFIIRKWRDLINHPVRPLWSVCFVAGMKLDERTGKYRPLLQGAGQDYIGYFVDLEGYLDVLPDGTRLLHTEPLPPTWRPDGTGGQVLAAPGYETGERLGGRLPPVMPISYAGSPGWTLESLTAHVLATAAG